jgi:hypothetical protein
MSTNVTTDVTDIQIRELMESLEMAIAAIKTSPNLYLRGELQRLQEMRDTSITALYDFDYPSHVLLHVLAAQRLLALACQLLV